MLRAKRNTCRIMGTAGAACLSADQLHIIILLIYQEAKTKYLLTSMLAIFISVAILSQLGSAVCDSSTSTCGS